MNKSFTLDVPAWILDTGVWRIVEVGDTVTVLLKNDDDGTTDSQAITVVAVNHDGRTITWDQQESVNTIFNPEDVQGLLAADHNPPGCSITQVDFAGPTRVTNDGEFIRIRLIGGTTNIFEWEYLDADHASQAASDLAVIAALSAAGYPTTQTAAGPPPLFDVDVPRNYEIVLEA